MRKKQERITCPICKKRILDVNLDGNVTFKTKCSHCGQIVKVICDSTLKPKVTKQIISKNTS